ncbi:hypothetical protein KIW84_022793 [Lathyrus oleraceus]|uniref:Uncharacterized protein n=1 Tax=Pisum sativum TaxID=3888 RepID=A0A9D4YCI5_PEA|nr:hypothetical protein KIW84_022793 [Pisum sativum]
MRDGIGNTSRRSARSRLSQCQTKSHVVPDITLTSLEPIQQGQWPNIPSELLLDIILREEKTETSWHARVVVSCAFGFVNEDFEFWRRFVKDMVEVKLEEYCLWRVSFKDI